MKFTILSHAGLCVDHNGIRLVSDPWLIGSCYWRSWWHLPEPPADLILNLKPDYIYLTHLHWDHFHGASLKKLFAPSTRILVPKLNTTRMLDDLRSLGFANIVEVPHGESIKLGDDFTLTSFQFHLLTADSAMLLSCGGRSLLNCNDCKLFGWPLKQITKSNSRIDFVLRSHSSANPIPYCVEGYKAMFPDMRSQQNYIEEFCRFALHIKARYAIPFASNHCFLHKDTIHFNETAVVPDDVRSYYQQLAARDNIESQCIVMAPGSSWSEADGFHIVPFDYSTRDQYISSLLEKHRDRLSTQYSKEDAAIADFDSFRNYMLGLISAIPWVARRYLKLRIVFRTRDALGEHNWLVDIATAKVEGTSATCDCPIIEAPALVLNDCANIHMFSAWTPSKRLRIYLPSSKHLGSVVTFIWLLDLYELEILPLRKILTPRALSVRLRRWREFLEMGRLFLKHKVFGRPLEITQLYPLPKARTGS